MINKFNILASSLTASLPLFVGPVQVAMAATNNDVPPTRTFHKTGFETVYAQWKSPSGVVPIYHEIFRDQDNNIAYCLEHQKDTPTTGDKGVIGKASDQVINVMLAGYPLHNAADLGVASTVEAEMATQLAIWIVCGSLPMDQISWGAPNVAQDAVNRVKAATMKLVAAQNSGQAQAQETKYSISDGGMKENDTDFTYDYSFTVSSNKAGSAKLTFNGLPAGSRVIQGTNSMAPGSASVTNNQAFTVKVPYQDSKNSASFSITGTNKYFSGWEYGGGSEQNALVALNVDQTTTGVSKAFQWTPELSRGKSTKMDDEGNALNAVTFNIIDSTGKVVKTTKTDSKGLIDQTGLPYGKYSLKEASTLTGYDLDPIAHPFTVDREHLSANAGTIINDHTPPSITSKLVNTEDNGGLIEPDNSNVALTDTIHYKNAIVGQTYIMNGHLMDKSTNKAFSVDGKAITSSKEFTPTATEGDVKLSYSFKAGTVKPTNLVSFATMIRKAKPDHYTVKHEDINDAAQTNRVTNPQIQTTATNKEDGSKEIQPLRKSTIVDKVSYTDLLPGKEYEVSGVLYDKQTKKPLYMQNGKTVENKVKFTPTSPNGSVDVPLSYDAAMARGKDLVVFEELLRKGNHVVSHADINDKGQTVRVTNPSVSTQIINSEQDGKQEDSTDGNVKFIDKINVKDLVIGKEYKIKGTMYDKTTGQPFIDKKGNQVTGTSQFKATAKDMTVPMSFNIHAKDARGKKLVAFQNIYYNGEEITQKMDINDEDETLTFNKPSIGTTASDSNGDKDFDPTGKVKVIDRVSYHDLIVGHEYTVQGTLMNKETAKPFMVDGKPITATTTFTAKQSSGNVDVIFWVDADLLRGKDAVVFENLKHNNDDLYIHANISDQQQTVHFNNPTAKTKAYNSIDGLNIADAEDATLPLVDKVHYEDLKKGTEYTISTVLMDKSTKKPLLINGKTVEASRKMKAINKSGDIYISMNVPVKSLKGKDIVFFETIKYGDKVMATHSDLNDKDQTISFPNNSIRTKAVNTDDSSKFLQPIKKQHLKDTVSYTGLVVGHEYTVTGNLMDADTGKAVMIDGKPVRSSQTFTPANESGEVTVNFTFDGTKIAGKNLVVFEDLTHDSHLVTVHHDIKDKDQSVKETKPEIHTEALDKSNNHETLPIKDNRFTDTVKYSGLVPGMKYEVSGVLMDKKTKEPLKTPEGQIKGTATFVPDKSEGEAEVIFNIDTSKLAGTEVVVFEDLSYNGSSIAKHQDIEDKKQTITVTNPKLGTTAKNASDNSNIITAKGKQTITDTVHYEGLVIGKEYHVTGHLMDKVTNQPLMVDGKTVESSATFIAHKSTDDVEVEFSFDASHLVNHPLVAFEYLSQGKDKEIAKHADINSISQTVDVTVPTVTVVKPKTFTPKSQPIPVATPTVFPKTNEKNNDRSSFVTLMYSSVTGIIFSVYLLKRRVF